MHKPEHCSNGVEGDYGLFGQTGPCAYCRDTSPTMQKRSHRWRLQTWKEEEAEKNKAPKVRRAHHTQCSRLITHSHSSLRALDYCNFQQGSNSI